MKFNMERLFGYLSYSKAAISFSIMVWWPLNFLMWISYLTCHSSGLRLLQLGIHFSKSVSEFITSLENNKETLVDVIDTYKNTFLLYRFYKFLCLYWFYGRHLRIIVICFFFQNKRNITWESLDSFFLISFHVYHVGSSK